MKPEQGRKLLEVITLNSASTKVMDTRIGRFEEDHAGDLSFKDAVGLAEIHSILAGSYRDGLSPVDRRTLFEVVERIVDEPTEGGEGLTMSALCHDLLSNFEEVALPNDVRRRVDRIRENYAGRMTPEAQIALSHIVVAATSHHQGLKDAAIRAEVFGLVTNIAGMPNGGLQGPSRGGTVLEFRKGKP